MKTLGYHTLIELCGCDPERLKRVRDVRRWMLEAARLANGTVVRAVFHGFSPWGVSGVVVIAESHLTIHTWPEHGYAAVDVFSCSARLKQAAVREYLRAALGARRVTSLRLRRGPTDDAGPVRVPGPGSPKKPRRGTPRG
ncbi:MAG: adenosylmethionine decarboxylase [Verrucomicrobia bacterium]|nr:MAG: adenosylmethionine decarboxylase [Verrucomicrobiota bacterium]